MSKDLARGPQSYENEQLLLGMLPDLLQQKGFTAVSVRRSGGMKLVSARAASGATVTFWVKQGWTDARTYSAIQFGLFADPDPEKIPDKYFTDYVRARVKSANAKGATHALLVHMVDGRISNYVALEVGDVARAYQLQMKRWPRRARNTKTPTLWFEDTRNVADAACVVAVTSLEVTLSSVCGLTHQPKGTADARKITAEIELRMRQQLFRQRVGNRCGWTCVVSGTEVREVLDAAHLPGKDWRRDNHAEDGVLVRTDLHRLLDRGLAEIRDGTFWLAKSARVGPYAALHNRALSVNVP
jgi:hypothetical protein